MTDSRQPLTILACSCEDTMALDGAALSRGCPSARIATHRHLCRSELDRFRKAASVPGTVVVGCTQEAPLFEDVAAAENLPARLAFANLREGAGWSSEGAAAGPKMAALAAAAAIEAPATPTVELVSDGVVVVYGRDEVAIEAGRRLADTLDVTVLLTRPGPIAPPHRTEFPIARGTIRSARGHLGTFELTVDDYALPAASSRRTLAFGPGRDGARSETDIVLDLSGGTPLFPAPDLRVGYLRADPGRPAEVERAIAKAAALAGTFDKPRFVAFDADLCAHSRSRIVGCRRCLDLCPTGAITPAGDHVAIDAGICAGCGSCAAACPTGAAAYAYPPMTSALDRLRALVTAFHDAGGRGAVVLVADRDHGAALIDAAARFGDGLPARVLPFEVEEVTSLGAAFVAAALAYGASAVRFLGRAKPKHDTAGLAQTVALMARVTEALGYGAEAVGAIETDDPDQLVDALRRSPNAPREAVSRFAPMGAPRALTRLALREMHRAAPTPVDTIALPAGAPFGRVTVATDGCTLCLACVSACPADALKDNPDRPMLRFDESLCVQCGLCAHTCPEKVITLEPRLHFPAHDAPPVTLKQEEPFACISCGKPFGTRSTLERVIAKLEGRHWMFAGQGARRLDLLRMCEDCRVIAVTDDGLDPHGAPPRPAVRTTEDYLREREALKQAYDEGRAPPDPDA